jgi:hypothetical protein
VSEVFVINRKIAKTLGREVPVMLRVSSQARAAAAPQARRQRLDDDRRQAIATLSASLARSCLWRETAGAVCRRRRNGRPRERLETNSVR